VNILAWAAALSAVFVLLWARNGIESVVAARAEDMEIRAVLKVSTPDSDARAFADRVTRKSPGIHATLIGRTEARALLSLQETWMKNLPEVNIGTLPAIVEIRHPALLTSPGEISRFLEDTGREPEVDFVMFNSIGYDSMLEFLAALRRHAWFVIAAVGAACVLLAAGCNLLASRWKGRHGFLPAVMLAALHAGAGGTVALVAMRAASGFVMRGHDTIPRLPWGDAGSAVLAAFVICLVLELKDVRLRGAGGRRSAR
jgi:hypothetical protein